ncbi:MAG TPA: DUF1918 domain-containing protein [Streptosporangiaceae bacterium]|nr:DUF1918 domain-containing protein [Streptosporangiaceae bacterium]
MRAHIGDRLLAGNSAERIGLIVGVPNDDGSPPYIVKWLRDGHLAMVFPDHYARIVPAGHPVGTNLDLGQPSRKPARPS